MNFLAHCLIPDRAAAPAHPDLIAGGFLGDFLKGPVPEALPAALATGVRLHRRIDAFSNQHPGIRASCDRFPAPLRRFAPIFVDVVADHLLAVNWSRFHPRPLTTFTAESYVAIDRHADRLPAHGQRFLDYARERDLFAGYRQRAVMHGALEGVLRRLKRSHLAAAAQAAADAQMDDLQADFLAYFPDLVAHAAAWLDDHG